MVRGRLPTVILRRSSVEAVDDPEAVTQAIVDYVNEVMRAGPYGAAGDGRAGRVPDPNQMAAWVAANPAVQSGFDFRAKALDDLDERFCAAERELPIRPLAARWIKRWPELQSVDGDRYGAEIGRFASNSSRVDHTFG